MVSDINKKQVHLPMKIITASSFIKRFWGLMFRKRLSDNEGLHLVPCNSIHMFFMKFAIDVVFLDKQNRVVEVIESLSPWKVVPPVKHAFSTLELPVGTIRTYNLQPGDKVAF